MKKSIILLLLVSLFLVSCTIGSGSSSAQGKGISARISTSPEINGRTLSESDTFTVNVEIINYFTSKKGINGYLCLNDQSGSTYGGVSDNNNCVPLSLAPAENINNNINPTGVSINFPNAGEYSYYNLGSTSIPNQIVADILYDTESIAGGVACVSTKNSNKCQGSQTISLNKQDAPLIISQIIASPSYRSNDVVLNLEIHIVQNDDGEILTPGNLLSANKRNSEVKIDVEMENKITKCTGSGFSGNTLEFSQLKLSNNKNEKIIKCKAVIDIPSDYKNVPINVMMVYGFKKRIEGPVFSLKKSEEELI